MAPKKATETPPQAAWGQTKGKPEGHQSKQFGWGTGTTRTSMGEKLPPPTSPLTNAGYSVEQTPGNDRVKVSPRKMRGGAYRADKQAP